MELNNHTEHEHASLSLKVILLIFAAVLVGVLAYFVWQQNTAPDTTDNSVLTTPKKTESTDVATNDVEEKSCDFAAIVTALKAAVTYDLGGTEEFDTLVCGYLTTKQEDMAFEGDPPLIKNRAYLNITEFSDAKFKAALDKQITEGNTVNSNSGGVYQLGCGCSENNVIISDTGDLADAASSTKLIVSTAQKPVIVKLGFQIHGGRGCSCCNLVDKLEVL